MLLSFDQLEYTRVSSVRVMNWRGVSSYIKPKGMILLTSEKGGELNSKKVSKVEVQRTGFELMLHIVCL